MKRFTTILTLCFAVIFVAAGADYAALNRRAQRFVDQQEWDSAQATFELMLAENPADPSLYGRAITVAGVRGDTVAQGELLRKSLANYVPLDSTFAQVRKSSFALCHADVYEQFLYLAAKDQPWLQRMVDAYLMRYYTFRRDPELMMHYSELMLAGLPDDIYFLTILAEGQMQAGRTAEALATYRRIVELDPENYHAWLVIGNLGALTWADDTEAQHAATVEALRKASALRPTPFVDHLITRLTTNE